MKPKILIIGATGELGFKLCNYCSKNKIKIFAITGFKNHKKLKKIKLSNKIPHSFLLSNCQDKESFIIFLKKNQINLIYFLDYGFNSIFYLDIIVKNNTGAFIAIANKEMIIAGGRLLVKKIAKTKNILIPLDSEHFSLFKSNFNNESIKKVYITASGGPFYFKKNINLNKVHLSEVINHPKWKMGINNSIDSSNFINKVLEIFELSIIFNIELDKIDFLVSESAFVHSIIYYKDGTVSLNCFNNNMIISLIYPLNFILDLSNYPKINTNIFDFKKFTFEKMKDKRFKISRYLRQIKNFNHLKQIHFMILNNKAHENYLGKKIEYNQIIPFIFNKLKLNKNNFEFSSFKEILSYIKSIN